MGNHGAQMVFHGTPCLACAKRMPSRRHSGDELSRSCGGWTRRHQMLNPSFIKAENGLSHAIPCHAARDAGGAARGRESCRWGKGCGRPVSRVPSRGPKAPWAVIHLEPGSPPASRDPPRPAGRRRPLAARPCGRPRPAQFDLAPGGACRAAPVAGGAVGLYPTVSPLPDARARRSVFCGAFPRVRGEPLPRPGVTRRRASVEPGLSSSPQGPRPPRKRDRPAVRTARYGHRRPPAQGAQTPSVPPTRPSVAGQRSASSVTRASSRAEAGAPVSSGARRICSARSSAARPSSVASQR